MAGNILWQSGAVINFGLQASGQGAQLTNGSRVQASGDLYNNGASGGPCLYGNFFWIGAPTASFGASVNANANIDLYLMPYYSGGELATCSTSGLAVNLFRGSFVASVSGNPARATWALEGIPLMPVRYQAWLHNQTGQTMASGWSLFVEMFNQSYT